VQLSLAFCRTAQSREEEAFHLAEQPSAPGPSSRILILRASLPSDAPEFARTGLTVLTAV